MEEHHGYDAVFVNEVTDHLKCVVCQMVLKDPVQIMGCGHRFCQKCFERIQKRFKGQSVGPSIHPVVH